MRVQGLKSALSVLIFFAFIGFVWSSSDDKPCAAKRIFGRSVVCVCNASYCDTIHRVPPTTEQFVTYVSTMSGSRFEKTILSVESNETRYNFPITLTLDPTKIYQTVTGFGGAVSDSAAINYYELQDPRLKQHLIESYCGDSGIQYNMLRVPIGGTDCSTHGYAYNELPEGDKELKNFTLAPEDYKYKLPMIKACMKAASADIDIVATTWSPPKWMKKITLLDRAGYLKKEYFQTYADYHLKFIKEYKKKNVSIWGVTTSNEPVYAYVANTKITLMSWTIGGMANWIVDHFGPTLKSYDPNLKLLGVDSNRPKNLIWFDEVVKKRPEVAKVLDGVAMHSYKDYIPVEVVTKSLKPYPNLFAIATETTPGIYVRLGSWIRAENYAQDIIQDLNNNFIGWIDWNLCLNKHGGPNWRNNSLDAAIIVLADEGVFYKQPTFYILGHFSKFLLRGSRRIYSKDSSKSLNHVAFLTPLNTIVVVVLNTENRQRKVKITWTNKIVKVVLKPKSITTLEIHP